VKFVRGRYQPDLLLTRWNAFSRVAVWPLRTGQGEASWGMSRGYRGPIPEQYGLVVDDTGYTTIARYRPGDDLGWARANLLSLPYAVRGDARALRLPASGIVLRFPATRVLHPNGTPRESVRPAVAVDIVSPSGGPGDPILYQALKLLEVRAS